VNFSNSASTSLKRTVSCYIRRLSPREQARKLWATFLRNHREVITAMDFFTGPTLTFRVLYCFFIIEHDRRKILHFNVTEHPTGPWIGQELREAFPESCPYRYAILDGDAKFGQKVTDVLRADGIKSVRISPASPWQNGVAERWIGNCRRELLDHSIILNDVHLRRLVRDYISYYHADRIHDSLEKDTPAMRPVSSRPDQFARLVSLRRIGGCIIDTTGRSLPKEVSSWMRNLSSLQGSVSDAAPRLASREASRILQHFHFSVVRRFRVHESRATDFWRQTDG
jgi:putative transposase